MSKRAGTDGSLLASLPWTLAALAFSVLPHIQFLPIWASLAVLTCSAWRWQVERKRWRLPPAWAAYCSVVDLFHRRHGFLRHH